MATIPLSLANRDVLGQAQTGTGKTAAFALPMLSRIDLKQAHPASPGPGTDPRELAIQVAEALQELRQAPCPASTCCRSTVARATPSSCRHLAPRRARHRRHPGRVIDHLERKTLDLSNLQDPGAGRSRRNAAHGLHRRCRTHLERNAGTAIKRRCSRPPCLPSIKRIATDLPGRIRPK